MRIVRHTHVECYSIGSEQYPNLFNTRNRKKLVKPKQTLLSWSSGKDSAWALHVLRQQPHIQIVGLVTTVNEAYQRVAMHAVRLELLRQQSDAVDLPLRVANIPHPCSNADYECIMQKLIDESIRQGVECMAFGDLFLQDIKAYRETQLSGTGITPLFPLWGIPTDKLSQQMVSGGLRASVTCIDPKQIPPSFIGREYNESFLADLPETVDPCGERGEFHTFAFDGPMFHKPVSVQTGEVVERDGFIFADLLPIEQTQKM
jgi:uncharacterized protein (TIGR00290 family)